MLHLEYTEDAMSSAYRYARSSVKEVCGVCYGRVWQTPDNRWHVLVEACWPAPLLISEHASVSFSHQSWVAALDQLDQLREQRPEYGWRIVGWYHSHPGFGIFFSSVDSHSHKTYFPQPWHVALVVDPQTNAHGWFGYDDQSGKIVRIRSQVSRQPSLVEPSEQKTIDEPIEDREVEP